jgi:hypothetical protein
MRIREFRRRLWRHSGLAAKSAQRQIRGSEKATIEMGKMIEQIWIRKAR